CLSQEIGKLEKQREQLPREDTNCSCSAIRTQQQLQPATRRSLSLDVAASIDVTIMTSQPQKIPTRLIRPILINGQPVRRLLLGRSSASMLGLFVIPGVIDLDYEEEIMIMVHTPYPPVKVSKGKRLAQLIPLPLMTKGLMPLKKDPRRQGSFSSTRELTLLTIDLTTCPKKPCRLSFQNRSITLIGLLDMGADTCIIALGEWPLDWPVQPSAITVTGIGGMTLANRTPVLKVEIDSKQAAASFSIAPLPPTVACLISRDVLSQLGLVL
ncbi:POK9 protein, partial [Acrocephalus arundinaceus]|nr:POK9 protein [Acrocephalus arundinaceus]